MSPILIRVENENAFSTPVPVGAPTNQPPALYRIAGHREVSSEGTAAGVWECTPGRFRRQVAPAEFSYFIKGEGSFTPDGGCPIEFRAGDSIFFAPNTQGEWEIRQTVLKSYVIFA